MRKKRWPLVLAAAVVVSVAGGILAAPLFTPTVQYETYEVTPTEVVKTVSANGQLAETQLLAYGTAEQPILIAANGNTLAIAQFGASLEVDVISVELGEEVSKGDLLFTYLNPLGQEIEVEAMSSGVVRSIDSSDGLRTSASVVTIGSTKPVVSVFVSEYDADLVQLGQVATIELDAINAVFEGTVETVGQVAQSVSGIKQYEVLLSVSSVPSGARFGMSATAEIVVQTKTDVLAIPLSALVGEEEPQVDVLVTDGESQSIERRTLTLGLIGDSFAEVTQGVFSGDQVITGISGTIPAPINFGPPPGVRQGG
jgi:multidrug efflux pump subunit AcrA (membrane-fusion protein)